MSDKDSSDFAKSETPALLGGLCDKAWQRRGCAQPSRRRTSIGVSRRVAPQLTDGV